MWRVALFVTAAMVISGGAVWGQEAAAGPASPAVAVAKGFDWSNLHDAARLAGDVRLAAEALERFGGVLERIATVFGKTMTEVSRNHAAMSAGFDPFGFKTAFETIREQNQTIRAMHKAEIRRLKKHFRIAKLPDRNRAKRHMIRTPQAGE